MATDKQRKEVFDDTFDWCDENDKLRVSIEKAKKNTIIFWEDVYPEFDKNKTFKTTINVSKDRSYQAAVRLKKEGYNKVAVMNFANAISPGGGVKEGKGAQEESLCRASTLYRLLYRKYLTNRFYAHHKHIRLSDRAKASDTLIYTEGVIICKTDTDLPERLPENEWTSVDVISVAAPDLRPKPISRIPIEGKSISMNDAELFGYHVKRAIHVLTCAAAKGVDALVLGAFGCGAFRNDPQVVARAYRTALQEFPNVFKHIEFAVYCHGQETINYQAFREIFKATVD